jgi:hypothetical protein
MILLDRIPLSAARGDLGNASFILAIDPERLSPVIPSFRDQYSRTKRSVKAGIKVARDRS